MMKNEDNDKDKAYQYKPEHLWTCIEAYFLEC